MSWLSQGGLLARPRDCIDPRVLFRFPSQAEALSKTWKTSPEFRQKARVVVRKRMSHFQALLSTFQQRSASRKAIQITVQLVRKGKAFWLIFFFLENFSHQNFYMVFSNHLSCLYS